MNNRKIYTLIAGVLVISTFTYGQTTQKKITGLHASIMTGYSGGYGIQTNIELRDIASTFPFDLRLGIGYSMFNPGIALDARRIFINNATNGVPEKSGRAFDYRLDFLMPRSIFGLNNSYLLFGPRFSSFKGNFKFIGGNEDFNVVSKQWGLGTGLENHFRISARLEIIFSAGLDFYFPNTLTGHDTSYSPDNDNVNPREDIYHDDVEFVYKDADRAINQPKFVPRALIGLSFAL